MALLVLVVRPVSVWLSLSGTAVPRKGRVLIAWLDPRGVVAASTAAAFTGTLAAAGIDADFLLPVVFGVILGTGVIYGLTASPVSSMLGLRREPPNGVLLVGSEPWVFDFARCLSDVGVKVLVATAGPVVDTDGPGHGIPRINALMEESDLRKALTAASIGKAVVVPSEDPRVGLVIAALVEILGRRKVYRVSSSGDGGIEKRMASASTAVAFGGEVTDEAIAAAMATGARFTELEDPRSGGRALVLAIVDPDGTVHVGAARTDPTSAQPNARLLGLAPSVVAGD